MSDPYKILGIKENATDEEIKLAYRELAKKYHPDQYGNNPLKDLAEDKMREINEAYNYLLKDSKNNNSKQNYSNENYNSEYNNFNEVRMYIQRGDISSAERALNNLNVRNGEWNYLMGMVHLKKGWNDSALNYISTACRLDPNNFEYRQALNMINARTTGYRQSYGNSNSSGGACDMCLRLWCLDSMCECFGGDCIPCC
ncbi:J domain-containing protein [Clostridium algidicarnis]|uniref:J domain-containing protein n=1 Tax=Clostridium algidicarnis TaxID=37659 RepID=UPI001CF2E733|nr:J domain-containing protein [Clostridium algidicarnis]MCB2287239.1 J domain-containing protein [Clostridium algidicarnis]